jgi:hypothetical protein
MNAKLRQGDLIQPAHAIRRHVIILAAATLFLGSAHATPVWVTGGFTSFDGNVYGDQYANFYQTVNGDAVCPTIGCTEFGNAHVNFAAPQSVVYMQNVDHYGIETYAQNSLRFMPMSPQEVDGTGPLNSFVLGTLLFENGIWNDFTRLGFTLTTHSTDSLLDGHTFNDTLVMRVSPNSFGINTPAQNSDYVYFEDTWTAGSVRAYEKQDSPTGTNIFSALIVGYIGSLHVTNFVGLSGDGFVDTGIDIEPTPVSVPEPAMPALLGAGLVAIALGRSRHGAKRSDRRSGNRYKSWIGRFYRSIVITDRCF